MSDDLRIGGEAFDARVREEEQIIYIYYDVEFENKFNNHQGLVNALENYVEAQTDYSGDKTVVFRADGK